MRLPAAAAWPQWVPAGLMARWRRWLETVAMDEPRPVWKKCAGYADYSADDNDADEQHPERIEFAACWHQGMNCPLEQVFELESDKEGLSWVGL